MKKVYFAFLSLLIFSLLFISCDNMLSLLNPEKTSLSIEMPQSRMAYSKEELVSYNLNLVYTGTEFKVEPIQRNALPGEQIVFEDLNPGEYTIELKGFNDTQKPIAEGSTNVTVLAGKQNTATVLMHLVRFFKISFDANGGEGTLDDLFCDENESLIIPEEYCFTAPEGKIFLGWSETKDGKASDFENFEVTKDTTLYAVWTLNTNIPYKVHHYQQNIDNDEYTLKDTDILSGTAFSITAAEKNDYEGFTNKTFSQTEIAADGSTVVNIYYDRNIISILFDLKGGKGTSELKGKYGAPVGTVDLPEKNGSVFMGWNPLIPQIFTENTNCSARWGYYVTFAGGSNAENVNGTMAPQLFEEGVEQLLAENSYTKKGYTFVGWSTVADSTQPEFVDKSSYKLNKNVTLYAVWVGGNGTPYKVEHYQQNLDDDEYTLTKTVDMIGVTDTQTLASVINYTGFTNKEFEQKKIEADGSTVVKIYYDRNIITFNFDFDGGTCTTPETLQGKYGASIGTVDIPEKTGKYFKGWNPELPETFTESGIYTVVWKPEYKVIFNVNSTDTYNLSGEMQDQLITEGLTDELKENAYKYFGMFFDGWNTAPDGTGNSYNDKDNIEIYDDTTLYAQWKAYKILPETEEGTQSTNKRYILMGMWPQTIIGDGITVNEGVTKTVGMYTYYKGSDEEWYAKQNVKRYGGYKYSNGNDVQSSVNEYFKVEPIKWCELTNDYEYDKTENPGAKASLLLAENVLTSDIAYFDYTGSSQQRTIDDVTVYGSNYKHSQIRAYLNGNTYTNYDNTKNLVEQPKWNDKGFLQTAFTSGAFALVLTTEVENGGESTTDAGNNISRADSLAGKPDYTCENTNDKIFLLSEQEVTTEAYGFAIYNDTAGKDSTRYRLSTDFAKANNAYQNTGADATNGIDGAIWWLRSPGSDFMAWDIDYNGKAQSQHATNTLFVGIVPALCIQLP